MKGLGANQTPTSITRIGKALGTIAPILGNFDWVNHVANVSGRHHSANSDKDLVLMIGILKDVAVFSETHQRKYPFYPNLRDPLHSITPDEFT